MLYIFKNYYKKNSQIIKNTNIEGILIENKVIGSWLLWIMIKGKPQN